ncbi:D-sedoheptulose-7-phosphate isomerase [Carnobacterium funditum]|uniref:D-sedoheptulose-7-phosphate isomerase n=1 Tax=Carnobacterium funditum TaxID=2752 RepID=UPI0005549856|nr:SIS domain-containing protein [Carnobacterium funditum]
MKVGIKQRIELLQGINDENYNQMQKIADVIVTTIRNGGKVLSAGNGGNAANAQHITGDIVGRYKIERKAYAAMTLTVDSSVMTAIGNDYGYDEVFARQVEGLGKEEDILIILSSSAHSPNLVKAVTKAKELGLIVIGFLGNNGGSLKDSCDYSLCIAPKDSDLAEEYAMTMNHMILEEVENQLVNG